MEDLKKENDRLRTELARLKARRQPECHVCGNHPDDQPTCPGCHGTGNGPLYNEDEEDADE